MAKKVIGFIKLQIPAGQANPAPPVGPALGQQGVNIMDFCKSFNAKTQDKTGDIIPVEITVYADRSFTFVTKTPPAARLILKAANIKKGSSEPNKDKVGVIKDSDLEKIAELTPHSNQNKKKFFVKKTKSLETTKKHFNDSQSLTGVELKEYSLLYLVMNNLNLLQANIHLIENIKLFTEVNIKIFELIIQKLKSGEQITIEDLKLDNQLLEKINKFAPIKHILKNQADDDQKTIELLEDISRDLMNYDLEFRIQELESKFSVDMSETTFNELKELKKKQNLN